MALTKVRLPVADIAAISFGTTEVTIASAGGDIDVNVAGVDVIDATSTTVTVGVTLVADDLEGEAIELSTASGATLSVQTTLADAEIQTTSAHPLVIGANSTDALTVETDGQVTLGVVGDTGDQLIDKDYVDTAIAAVLGDIVATTAVTGSVTIPNDTGNDLIINWGTSSSLGNDNSEVQTFDTAFPNAFLVGYTTPNRGLGGNGTFNVNNGGLTSMTVYNTTNSTCACFWLAIGY